MYFLNNLCRCLIVSLQRNYYIFLARDYNYGIIQIILIMLHMYLVLYFISINRWSSRKRSRGIGFFSKRNKSFCDSCYRIPYASLQMDIEGKHYLVSLNINLYRMFLYRLHICYFRKRQIRQAIKFTSTFEITSKKIL